jgi:hypothetical protein
MTEVMISFIYNKFNQYPKCDENKREVTNFVDEIKKKSTVENMEILQKLIKFLEISKYNKSYVAIDNFNTSETDVDINDIDDNNITNDLLILLKMTKSKKPNWIFLEIISQLFEVLREEKENNLKLERINSKVDAAIVNV